MEARLAAAAAAAAAAAPRALATTVLCRVAHAIHVRRAVPGTAAL